MHKPKYVYYQKLLLAVIIRTESSPGQTAFYSPAQAPLQVGSILKTKGETIRPHMHKEPVKTVRVTQEVLYIEKGKLRVDLYAPSGKLVYQTVLKRGDKIFLAAGGHGFTILENTRIFEVKQGPYPGYEKAKKYLDSHKHT